MANWTRRPSGFGELLGQLVETAEDQFRIAGILQVGNEHVLLWHRLQVAGELGFCDDPVCTVPNGFPVRWWFARVMALMLRRLLLLGAAGTTNTCPDGPPQSGKAWIGLSRLPRDIVVGTFLAVP